MASTLIKRVCDPEQLTDAEVASVVAELGVSKDSMKLRLHAVVGVASEAIAGRLDGAVMGDWLTVAEVADANAIIVKIQNGTFTVQDVWLMFLLGENGIYTASQIEVHLGL